MLAACASSPPPTRPVPATAPVAALDPTMPALRLPRYFTPTRYVATLAIDPAAPTFHGHIEITGALAQRAAVIWLHGEHLAIADATISNGRDRVAATVTARGDDLLEVRPATPLEAGPWTVAITYDGTIVDPGYVGAFRSRIGNDAYVATQFESTTARLVFPCIDEPDRKTVWQLSLDVPASLVAVSNTHIVARTPLGDGKVHVEFAPTRPLPSYLVAFAVGPYDVVDAGRSKSGLPIHVYAMRGEAARVAVMVEVMPKIVDALEAWFGTKFPYDKLDLVPVPSLRGAAMENAGMIVADWRDFETDPAHPSALARHDIVNLFGHETAHQWFGDLVTAAWWDDLWLNESFATWMEPKVEEAIDPSWHSVDEYVVMRNNAFNLDRLVSARKIRQPIVSAADIHNAFDAITYPKGGAVLRMFELAIGPDVFQRGIRAYLASHADGNATVVDLIASLEHAAGAPIGPALSTFVDQPGVPTLEMTLACGDGPPKLRITQHRDLLAGSPAPSSPSVPWQVPVCVAFPRADHSRGRSCTTLTGPSGELALDTTGCPAWILPNAANGYYRSALAPALVTALRDLAWPQLTMPEKLIVLEDARAAALDGTLPVAVLGSLVPKMLETRDRFAVAAALGDVELLGWVRGLPAGLAEATPDDLRAVQRAKVRASIAPLVKQLGLVASAHDDVDAEMNRRSVLATALLVGEPASEAAATRRIEHYRELPHSSRAIILGLAANASPAIDARLRADAVHETDPLVRQDLWMAVGAVRDPKRRATLLALVLGPDTTSEDSYPLLFDRDPDVRAETAAWLRAHVAEVLKRFPASADEDFPRAPGLAEIFTRACDAAHRDDIARYVTATFGSLANGARPVAQFVEQMDQCIATKRRLDASFRAWLGAK